MIEIFALEKALLSNEVRRNAKALDELIADDFIEFGRSGKVWSKGDILKSLPFESEIQREITNFRVIFSTLSIVCVEYKLSESGEISLRRSIWKLIDKRWQMVLHKCIN